MITAVAFTTERGDSKYVFGFRSKSQTYYSNRTAYSAVAGG